MNKLNELEHLSFAFIEHKSIQITTAPLVSVYINHCCYVQRRFESMRKH